MTAPIDDPRVGTALAAAAEAADLQRERFRTDLSAEYKAPRDLVTEVDRESERRIVERIEAEHPGDAVLAEEGTEEAGGEVRWIVDPLDGTTNFVHGHAHFAVSIGIERDGRLEAGVVHQVPRGDVYAATRDAGAYRNGEPIGVSDAPSLGESLIGTGIGADIDAAAEWFEGLEPLHRRVHSVRELGSAASDLAHVAEGSLDGYYHHALSPWDLAAGALVVEAAGGETNADAFRAGEAEVFVATNGRIGAELRDLLGV